MGGKGKNKDTLKETDKNKQNVCKTEKEKETKGESDTVDKTAESEKLRQRGNECVKAKE